MDQRLRRELVAMADEDLRVRDELLAAGKLPRDGYAEAMAAVHRRNNARLRAIVAEHGWPGRRLVGDDGADAAWLLAQHAVLDPDLQRQCVGLLAAAVAAGDALPRHLAYLEDRVRMMDGATQRYGTQHVIDADGRSVPWPIADPEGVDERRRAVGLGPLAEHTARLRREDTRLSPRGTG